MSNNTSTPLEMDYTNRDYDSILTFLVSAAKGFMPEWVTVGEPSDFGTLLLELYAYMGDVLNYYIDRVAAEPFLATAVRRQSILGIAGMLGYTPIAQQTAFGVVTFSLDDDTSHVDPTDLVTIPSGTVVQTSPASSDGAVYYETVGVLLLGGDTRFDDVGVNEGLTVSSEFVATSNSAPFQEYVLTKLGVIHRTVNLQVQETDQVVITWSYTDNLVTTDPDASVFTTYVDDRNYMHVVFGDNVAGRIPPNGADITVSYRYGAGAAGNVVAGMINQITPPITGVSVINSLPTTGGADVETIESMRHSIPRAAKLRDRAVTLQDYADLAHQVPGVAKATATGEFYSQVKVYIAPVGGGPGAYPSDQLKLQVAGYLQLRSLVGVTVEIHPIDTTEVLYVPFAVHVTVHVMAQYGRLTVTNAVDQALRQLFSFANQDFGSLVTVSSVYHTAMSIKGVDYIILDSMSLTGTTTGDVQASPTQIPICGLFGIFDYLVVVGIGGLV